MLFHVDDHARQIQSAALYDIIYVCNIGMPRIDVLMLVERHRCRDIDAATFTTPCDVTRRHVHDTYADNIYCRLSMFVDTVYNHVR